MDWSQIADIIRLVGGVGKAGMGIMSAFEKEPLPYGVAEAGQAAHNANVYANASLDPSSPYYRNIVETEELKGRGDLIASVDQIIRQLASRSATGRGTINPERKDEMVWGVLAKGFQEAGMRAREMARQKLLEMSGAQRGIASSYSGLANPSMMMQLLNRQSTMAGRSAAFESVNALAGTMKTKKDQGVASIPDWWSGGTPEEKQRHYRPWGS